MVLTSTRTSPYVGPVGPKSFWTQKPLSLVKKHHFLGDQTIFWWVLDDQVPFCSCDSADKDTKKLDLMMVPSFHVSWWSSSRFLPCFFCLRWGHHHGLVPWWRGFENPHGKCLGNHGLNPLKPIGNHRKPIGNHRKPIGNHGGFQFQFSLKSSSVTNRFGGGLKGDPFFPCG